MYTKIDQQIGEVSLNDVTVDHIMGWYRRWSAAGKQLPTGYAHIQMIKALLRYGAGAEDPRCATLCGALRAIHFPHGNKTVQRINRAQVDAIRAAAHKMKWPSLALAQAFQFDLKLYDGQIIGEWVPLTEPGESAIQSRTIVWRWGTKRSRPAKWLRGLQWSQIDEDHTLRHEVNGKTVKIDLRRHPGIMAELKKLTPLPKSGPLIVYEKTGSPYTDAQYRWLWRRVATRPALPRMSATSLVSAKRRRRPGAAG
jgi:hypothetical protein